MGFFELFSSRNNIENVDDVYEYDKIPMALRNQIILILRETIDPYKHSERLWEILQSKMLKEFGLLSLNGKYHPQDAIEKFILSIDDADTIDAIDLIFYLLEYIGSTITDGDGHDEQRFKRNTASAIEELNFRFKKHNVGYEFVDKKLIKINNQFLHEEVVKPAIQLLFEEGFETASSEYMQAHNHFRAGEFGEAIADAENSFESTIKIICHKNGYEYKSNFPAKKLIAVLLENGFIPQYLQTHFSQLCNTLENGLPTVRNKNGSHGQGIEKVEIPSYMANYAINLCATNIVFLVNIYKSTLK